jgi:hypothetical protein
MRYENVQPNPHRLHAAIATLHPGICSSSLYGRLQWSDYTCPRIGPELIHLAK